MAYNDDAVSLGFTVGVALEPFADILSLQTDKATYYVGDTMSVQVFLKNTGAAVGTLYYRIRIIEIVGADAYEVVAWKTGSSTSVAVGGTPQGAAAFPIGNWVGKALFIEAEAGH